MEPETGGDPEGHAKYTRSSLRSLAKRLGRASSKTVGRLLKGMDYSLRTNVKRLAGKPHPHRDQQYRFIQRAKALFRRHGDPVISVDAKKTELVGNFKNAGECWCVVPEEVNMYDFPSDATGKATPYGLYDQVANHAYVVVGMSAVTAAFAVACIRRWWTTYGRISSNWAGYPLRSLRRILGFIRGTSTETGLTVDADVDPRAYEKGIKISDQEMRTLNLTCRRLCPNLNYTIRPRQSGNS